MMLFSVVCRILTHQSLSADTCLHDYSVMTNAFIFSAGKNERNKISMF